jgi:hypothetical protein
VVDKLADDPNQISQSPYQYAWNNPIYLTDPDGNCPWCIAGAIIGAVVDYGMQVAMAYASGVSNPWTNVNGASISASLISGAATGGLSSLAKTGLITTTRAVAASMTVQATESIAKQSSEGTGTINPTRVIIDVTANQIADGIPAKNLVQTNQLEKQLDRTVRVAGETPRQSRAAAVSAAQGRLNTANTINQINSAAQSEVAENSMQVAGALVTNNNSRIDSNSSMYSFKPSTLTPSDNTRIVKPLQLRK